MAGVLQLSLIAQTILTILYQASFYLMPKKEDIEKLSPYESGFEPQGDARMKISILYWIIGILYQIFDLEIIFLFPFSVIMYNTASQVAQWTMMGFFIILTLAFIYEYKKGALELL